MLRVLRIAANQSANIGGSLTTPAHHWPDRPKRTRYVVAVPLRVSSRGSRHVRCVAAPPLGVMWNDEYRRTLRLGGMRSRMVWYNLFLNRNALRAAGSLPDQGEVLPRDRGRRKCGDLGHVVGWRDLHYVHASKRDAAQPSQDRLCLP